jgi:sulfite reductase (ferredoxin)
LLLDKNANVGTQIGMINKFDELYVSTGEFALDGTFSDLVLQINKNEPSKEFATTYRNQADAFLAGVKAKREALVQS